MDEFLTKYWKNLNQYKPRVMCLQPSAIRPHQKWNWAGDEILTDTALPVSRALLRKGKKIHSYEADIREFLSIEKNAVIKKLITKLIKRLPIEDQQCFFKSNFGNRDFRVRCCQLYLKNFVYSYSSGGFDTWQYPEETIVLQSGDCEDFAFLLAGMMEACDISPYCLRVAFGKVIDHSSENNTSWDHSWVMYQNESGSWQIIEPCQYVKFEKKRSKSAKSVPSNLLDVEYIPHYVFNRDHMWRVRPQEENKIGFAAYARSRNFFNKFHPAFAAKVHDSIFDEALKESISWSALQRIKAVSLYVDVNTIAYDPRDHFDFAYVDESWERVQRRLSSGTLNDFALAAHSIADFYAHSYYGYFMINNGVLPVYDPANPLPPSNQIQYDFSTLGNLPGCKSDTTTADPATYWSNRGKIISGQWYRVYAAIPNSLQNSADFPKRRCLPDHDAVAVDSPTFNGAKHKLFSQQDYGVQFQARKKAAIHHIKQAYQNGKGNGTIKW